MALDLTLNIHDLYVASDIFQAIADNVDRSVPDGAAWHRDLLQQMSVDEPGLRLVIPPETWKTSGASSASSTSRETCTATRWTPDGVEQTAARARRIFPAVASVIDDLPTGLNPARITNSSFPCRLPRIIGAYRPYCQGTP
ncbi:MAG: hypothetical protein U5Q44_13860 [Dehalococcoidia bacterium]|nr:hypothetical protein [Dehalococcoidia bacterium]